MSTLKLKDKVYYARIIPSSFIFDVLELQVRTVDDGWYVGIEKKDKQAFLFLEEDIGSKIFIKRADCLKAVNTAEKNYKVTGEQC